MAAGLAETVIAVVTGEAATLTATHAEAPAVPPAAVYVAVMLLDPGDRFVPMTVSAAVPTPPDTVSAAVPNGTFPFEKATLPPVPMLPADDLTVTVS